MRDLTFMTATELAPLIKNSEVSPVDVTQQFLDRIEALDDELKAYITILPDEALAQARQAEEDIQNGHYKGPMHGIPVAIKDNYETQDVMSTGGAKFLEDNIPEETAFSVKRMLDEGAIMLGKLNMHPLGTGLSGSNPDYGTTKNVWNTNHMPGASSSGSGAALAGGLATLTTGTDTFGSIRVPAAMSGVYGLKPTYGRVSSDGVIPLAWSLDHPGPMTRSASDLALMMNYMAGHNPKDPTSLEVPAEDYTENLETGIKGLKIGVPTTFKAGLDEEMADLFKDSLDKLERLGATVQEVEIPELSMAEFAGYVLMTAEAAAYNDDLLQENPEAFAKDSQALLMFGKSLSATQYIQAQQVRRKLTAAFKDIFEEVDVLAGPVVPVLTPSYEENWVEQNLAITERSMRFTAPATLTGTPAVAVPMGIDTNGLPAGMQFIGKHLAEKQLLQIAKAWETTNPISYKAENVNIS